MDNEWASDYLDKEITFHSAGGIRVTDVEGAWIDICQSYKSANVGSKTVSMFTEDFEDVLDSYLKHKGYPSIQTMKESYDFLMELANNK